MASQLVQVPWKIIEKNRGKDKKFDIYIIDIWER